MSHKGQLSILFVAATMVLAHACTLMQLSFWTTSTWTTYAVIAVAPQE